MVSKAGRCSNSQRLHDTAVLMIAQERFGLDDWEVKVNLASEENEAVQVGSSSLYPDIVARHADGVVAVGEIETCESLSDAEVEQWRMFSDASPRLYLFVPEGAEVVAAELIEKHKISCAGLRTYAFGDGDGIRVESVYITKPRFAADNHPWWRDLGSN